MGAMAALGAGVASAVLFLSIATGTSAAFLLNLLAPLPLFAVGLSRGAGQALVAAAAGTVVVGLAGPLAGIGGGLETGLGFLVAQGLAPVLVARQALLNRPLPDGGVEWYPPGHLLLWLVAYAALVLAGLLVLFAGAEGGPLGALVREVRAAGEAMAEVAAESGAQALDPADAEASYALVARLLPGAATLSWLVTMVANGAIAQALLVRSNRALRPSPAYVATALPPGLGMGLATALAVGALVGASEDGTVGLVGLTVAMVLAVPFLLIGLAVVHAASARWSARTLVLCLFYVVAASIYWLWPAIVLLGVVENWVGIRQRLAAGRPSRGEQ